MPTDVPINALSAFFSYCRADSDFALKLAEDLKAGGANVWIDQLDIEPGTPWDGAVEDALRNAPRMLVILSTVSVVSANVRDEIAYALDRQKRIIPVLVSECDVPIRLARLQHIDFRTDYARGLRLLLKSLGVEAQAPAPTPAEVAAEKVRAEQAELDHKAAEEEARQEEIQRKLLADEQDQFEAAKRQSAAESLRLEQERKHLAAEQAPPSFQETPVATTAKFPAWGKLAAGAGAAVLLMWLLYAALFPSKQPASKNQPETQAQQRQPTASVPPGLTADMAEKYREAQAGDRVAMTNVGYAYSHGDGAPQDDQRAVYWYRKAADAGDPIGMANLGIMYENGRGGLPLDYQQAVYWYRKAADAGNPQGMRDLGFMYHNGRGGLPQDYDQAVYWYRKAANAGHPEGMADLGFMYEKGRGVPQDQKQAVYWYRKAADAGYPDGMIDLGFMYENGRGGLPQDYKQAVYWYRKAADAGNATGMSYLADMYENGKGVKKDLQQAVDLYRKAAGLGDQYAKDALKRLGKNP